MAKRRFSDSLRFAAVVQDERRAAHIPIDRDWVPELSFLAPASNRTFGQLAQCHSSANARGRANAQCAPSVLFYRILDDWYRKRGCGPESSRLMPKYTYLQRNPSHMAV
jgi:hypothetical protein